MVFTFSYRGLDLGCKRSPVCHYLLPEDDKSSNSEVLRIVLAVS